MLAVILSISTERRRWPIIIFYYRMDTNVYGSSENLVVTFNF